MGKIGLEIAEEEFLAAIDMAATSEDAIAVLNFAVSHDTSNAEKFYKPNIEDVTWKSFYAARELEEKFELSDFVSAYLATSLAKPKIKSFYSEISGNVNQDLDDFFSRTMVMIGEKLIPAWDKQKNDNFFAYLQPNLRTIRNELLSEDGGPSKYLKETKGFSSVSMEYLKEKTESGWDAMDHETNTEEAAFKSIDRDKKELLKRVIGLKQENNATSENIWNSIICQKLFHGKEEGDLEVLNDAVVAKVLNRYFDAIDSGRIKGPMSVDEKPIVSIPEEDEYEEMDELAEELA